VSETPHGPEGDRPRARPRFEIVSEHPPRVIVNRVRRALRGSQSVVGQAFEGRVELTVMREATHLWSPQLIVDIEAADAGTLLKARFAPHPHVWTMYVGACVIACMATFGMLMLAIAQFMMKQPLWGLWVAPGTALVAGLTFGAAFVGQGLSAPQMFELRDFLQRTVDAPSVEGESERPVEPGHYGPGD